MKPFSKQYQECTKNGTAENMPLLEAEKLDVRPNVQGIESINSKSVIFCNKYMTRCKSSVCLKERMKLITPSR